MNFSKERLAALVGNAVDALRTLVSDPTTPPSVRLRAAKVILDMAADHDDPPSEPPGSTQPRESAPERAVLQFPEPEAPCGPKSLSPRPSLASRAGRNDLCPCGSGIKYKKCCLNRPVLRIDEAALLLTSAGASHWHAPGASIA